MIYYFIDISRWRSWEAFGLEEAGRATEGAGRVSEPAGRALEPAGVIYSN